MLEACVILLNLWKKEIIEVKAKLIFLSCFSTAVHVQFAAIRCLVNLKIVLSNFTTR